jgi:outer membrane protein TolC
LLEAEQGLRQAEDAYARTHTEATTSLVSLHKALGGGWRATGAD